MFLVHFHDVALAFRKKKKKKLHVNQLYTIIKSKVTFLLGENWVFYGFLDFPFKQLFRSAGKGSIPVERGKGGTKALR